MALVIAKISMQPMLQLLKTDYFLDTAYSCGILDYLRQDLLACEFL